MANNQSSFPIVVFALAVAACLILVVLAFESDHQTSHTEIVEQFTSPAEIDAETKKSLALQAETKELTLQLAMGIQKFEAHQRLIDDFRERPLILATHDMTDPWDIGTLRLIQVGSRYFVLMHGRFGVGFTEIQLDINETGDEEKDE